MMRIVYVILIIGASIGLVVPEARSKRFLDISILDWLATEGRCSGCPSRHCLDDPAVIDGWCCGCSRVTDYLPIPCRGIRGHCPEDGRRLCRDYDYMLDCCCPSF